MNIHFEKAALKHIDIIFIWLQEKHIQEFWDNSQNHKEDILNFIYGKPQKHFAGAQPSIGLVMLMMSRTLLFYQIF